MTSLHLHTLRSNKVHLVQATRDRYNFHRRALFRHGEICWGGGHIDMAYEYVPAFWGLFRKIQYIDRWVFIRDEGAQNT